jgi:hypothetical protein
MIPHHSESGFQHLSVFRVTQNLKVLKPTSQVKKDEREIRTVGEIDYAKYEKMELELKKEEELKKWKDQLVTENARPPIPGCGHDHQRVGE